MHYNLDLLVLNTYLYISDEEIGHDQFMTLTESMIRELIPKVGRRSTFFSKFINFKDNQVSKTIPKYLHRIEYLIIGFYTHKICLNCIIKDRYVYRYYWVGSKN